MAVVVDGRGIASVVAANQLTAGSVVEERVIAACRAHYLARVVHPVQRIPVSEIGHQEGGHGAEARAASIGFLEEAARADPEYAPAYAGLATAYSTLAFHLAGDVGELVEKARAARGRAPAGSGFGRSPRIASRVEL